MLAESTLSRLKSQMSRGELVCFTGAGFSISAKNRAGKSIPSVSELKHELWQLSFPGRLFDSSSSLGDLFAVGAQSHSKRLAALLQELLSVDPATIPEFYRLYFNCPWLRWYTLNIDDLAQAISSKSDMRRSLEIVSATSQPQDADPRKDRLSLDYVHLNGHIRRPIDQITFSEIQFAKRLASREPWYSRCAADIYARPVIFIGTELREPPLWQHMELRRRDAAPGRDLRPTSLLITPSLDPSRQEILRTFRIDWLQGTAESFAVDVLAVLANEIQRGYVFFEQTARFSGRVYAPLVSELLEQAPKSDTNYLIGDEPQWSDFLAGRVIERSSDSDLLRLSTEILSDSSQQVALAITGTAGTGKSSSLRGLAIRLSAEGAAVLWVDKESEVSPARIRDQVAKAPSGSLVLAIDDADLFGEQLVLMIRDLVTSRLNFLLVFAVRSSKIDGVTGELARLGREAVVTEHVVPNLTNDDIDLLVKHLDQHNRLGILKGKTDIERRLAFEQQAGRQLLVAMIEATSGSRFEEKAAAELTELKEPQRYIYGLLNLASTMRCPVTKDEILLAIGSVTGDSLAALETLVIRHLVTQIPGPKYRARHRVIADIVVTEMRKLEQLKEAWIGLAVAMASKVDQSTDHSDRCWRLLIRLINHKRLRDFFGPRHGRDIYVDLEQFLANDYHYWLQRGSLEVESADVRLAEQFIGQARSLAPDDHLVKTAFAYVCMRKACEYRDAPSAREWFEEGVVILEEEISERGRRDPYPVHVLGSQGLTWVRHPSISLSEKRSFLTTVLSYLKDATRFHPSSAEVGQLKSDVDRELLLTAVR
jgi:hypothetical protein